MIRVAESVEAVYVCELWSYVTLRLKFVSLPSSSTVVSVVIGWDMEFLIVVTCVLASDVFKRLIARSPELSSRMILWME